MDICNWSVRVISLWGQRFLLFSVLARKISKQLLLLSFLFLWHCEAQAKQQFISTATEDNCGQNGFDLYKIFFVGEGHKYLNLVIIYNFTLSCSLL